MGVGSESADGDDGDDEPQDVTTSLDPLRYFSSTNCAQTSPVNATVEAVTVLAMNGRSDSIRTYQRHIFLLFTRIDELHNVASFEDEDESVGGHACTIGPLAYATNDDVMWQ